MPLSSQPPPSSQNKYLFAVAIIGCVALTLLVSSSLFELRLDRHQLDQQHLVHLRKSAAIVSFATGPAVTLANVTFPNKRDYARRHGYDFINYAEWNSTLPSNISDLPVYFNKYKAILDMLEVGYDWVLWSDSDSIFMNFSTPILDFADNRFDVIAPTAEPANSIFHGVPNTGHILVKNSAWSKTYFNYLLRQVTEPCDRLPVLNGWLSYCNYYPGSSTFDQFWLTDQGLMGYSWQRWGSDVECHVKKVAFGQFNSEFPWYQEGETVIHFPGRENPQRIKMLGDLLSMLDVETGLLDHSSEHFQFLHPSNLHPDLSVGESKVFMEKMFLDAGMNQPCVGDEGAESILANAFQKTNIKET
ncbi:hypothetical protein HDU83_006140 [Entophlyctis luteolus]|nr:hypothetical protein HDU83_006140 [Entophlyctis luteolus]KAJ3389855.1 hypothetical protein HDU84_008225 [Entophlyctis sp. JEL0112]